MFVFGVQQLKENRVNRILYSVNSKLSNNPCLTARIRIMISRLIDNKINNILKYNFYITLHINRKLIRINDLFNLEYDLNDYEYKFFMNVQIYIY